LNASALGGVTAAQILQLNSTQGNLLLSGQTTLGLDAFTADQIDALVQILA
jgi:hypothetical protein